MQIMVNTKLKYIYKSTTSCTNNWIFVVCVCVVGGEEGRGGGGGREDGT